MKKISIALLLMTYLNSHAQELFVFTEPASNMATNSIGIRLSNTLRNDETVMQTRYMLIPEIMFGVSKKIMVHAQVFMSNGDGGFSSNGAGAYIKYRFFSVDDIHSHFRMAVFGRYAFNNSAIHQPAIDLMGFNSGYQGGVVATKLLNKVALSATLSALHATDNGNKKFPFADKNRNAINYSFSTGKLLLPKEYVSYKQVNVNFMLEFLGQTNASTGASYLDIAPSLQFIINSQLRIDAGYRYALVKKLPRIANQSVALKLEYNFFNVFKQ